MRSLLSPTVILGLACVFSMMPASAQLVPNDVCKLSDTVDECETKVQEALDFASEANVVAEAWAEITKKNTGTGSSVGTARGVLDYLLKLAIDANSGGLGDDQETVTLELNEFLGLPTQHGYKLTAQLEQATVSDKLLAAFPEATRAAKKEELAKTLDDLDNATLALSWSPQNRRYGRDPDQQADLWNALFATAKRRVENLTQASGAAANQQDDLLQHMMEIPDLKALMDADAPDESKTVTFQQIANDPTIKSQHPTLVQELLIATVRSQEAWTERVEGFDAAAAELSLAGLADLIDNQPQLEVKLQRTERNELVGANESSVALTYQHGFVNVNRLRNRLDGCGVTAANIKAVDLGTADTSTVDTFSECYRDLMSTFDSPAQRSGQRFTVSLDYRSIDSIGLDLGEGIRFDLPSDDKVVGSLAWGRYLSFDGKGVGQSRIDLSWAYEWTETAEMRNRRSVAELSYAQRVSGDLVMSAGFVWANKPEFITDVQQDLSVQVGLKYKLFSKSDFGTK